MRPELLAPAGDLARAKIAYLYGADAVYVGGKRFSLRARASNFDLQDLKEAAEFAHRLGKKLYVTVNMIPHEEDLEGLNDYLIDLDRINVDAIIVASLAIAQAAYDLKVSYEVHLSTQLSVTNSKTIDFYTRYHIDRVVLARELDLESIRQLIKKSPVSTEVFIHGGMCVNYSGRCTLSNDMTLRDANRGGCAQSCRWAYELTQNGTVLSVPSDPFTMGSKDLMALDDLSDLIDAGVQSLKIEGRMKSAYYIAVIVKAYRTWIDALLNHTAPEDLKRQLLEELRQAESRLTFSGFLRALPNQNGQVYVSQEEGALQNFVGTILSVDGNTAVLEVRNNLKPGETLEVFSADRPLETFVLTQMIDDQGQALSVANKPLAKLIINVPSSTQAGDFIRRKKES